MDVLKWCKNSSKWLHFPVLFHVSILIILLPTAEMVKNNLNLPLKPFDCECHFWSLESSILNLSIHPAYLYYVLDKESLWDSDELAAQHPGARVEWWDVSHDTTSLSQGSSFEHLFI